MGLNITIPLPQIVHFFGIKMSLLYQLFYTVVVSMSQQLKLNLYKYILQM